MNRLIAILICALAAAPTFAAEKTAAETAAPVDPAIANIAKVAKANAARYEVIAATINRYDPAKTNLFVRPARASMQTKLDNARTAAREFYVSLTNEVAHSASLSNALDIVNGQLAAAQAKITDEIADLEAKVTKYQEYQTKYPLFKTLWTALINDAQNRIKILQALTGGNK